MKLPSLTMNLVTTKISFTTSSEVLSINFIQTRLRVAKYIDTSSQLIATNSNTPMRRKGIKNLND